MRRSIHGEAYARWTTEHELLAGLLFTLQVANRQRRGKGPKPKPVPRPKSKTERKFAGNTVMSLDDIDALIGWKSPRQRE